MKKLLTAVTALALTTGMISAFPSYAEAVNYDVLSEESVTILSGDVNRDGNFSIADGVLMQKYLVGAEKLDSLQYQSADINLDGKTDIFDMVRLKKSLVSGEELPSRTYTYTVIGYSGEYPSSNQVINSKEELLDVSELPEEILSEYDGKFFEENSLLLLSAPQYGRDSIFSVCNVSETENGVTVNITAEIPETDKDLPSVSLMQISLPKIESNSVIWEYYGDNRAEIIKYLFGNFFTDTTEDLYYYSKDKSYILHISENNTEYTEGGLSFEWIDNEFDENTDLGFYETDGTMPFVHYGWDDDGYEGEWGTSAEGYDMFYSDKFALIWKENSLTVDYLCGENEWKQLEFEYPDRTTFRQNFSVEINESSQPEIQRIDFAGDCRKDIADLVKIEPVTDYIPEDRAAALAVSNSVGVPFRYMTSPYVYNTEITIHYDEEELNGVQEQDLELYHYYNGVYEFLRVDCKIDTENNTITFNPCEVPTYTGRTGSGIYCLRRK